MTAQSCRIRASGSSDVSTRWPAIHEKSNYLVELSGSRSDSLVHRARFDREAISTSHYPAALYLLSAR